ncbi:LuxR C-terminal-related transcriptional regulator [Paeniglutamicibacter sp. NPDC091659]|uniref:LuxR C-terminal-related transcriptional regulator n=1 Tax=Paeniglutamicibacter sp. NPDC091659 TaxID=3364389 RepID=UPI00380D9B00
MNQPKIRVHLADGDYFLRIGLESLLASSQEVELEDVSSNGNDAVEAALSKKPDLVLMESGISNVCSMEATRRIVAGSPEIKVVMFSATHDLETMSRAHSAGACSYLAKNSISTNLDAALLMIHSGNMVYSKPADAQRFPVSSVNSYDLQAQFLRQTNPRGRRLLNALANGYTNSEIATMLHVSEGTVKAQLAKIMEPLNVKNRVQLAVLVAQAGLLEEARPTLPLTSGPARYATPRA